MGLSYQKLDKNPTFMQTLVSKKLSSNFDFRFQDVHMIVIKVTQKCNLDCAYCYENISSTGSNMSIGTFKKIIDKIIVSTTKKEVTLLFHGGEPSMLPNEWYEEAISYAIQKGHTADIQFQFAMQTNGLMPKSKIEFYAQKDINISISLDGPETIPQPMRDRTEKANLSYKRMKEAGLSPGVLMTINESNYAYQREILEWLEEEIDAKTFKANIVYPVGEAYTSPPLEPEFIFWAQSEILEYMIQTRGEKIIEHNIAMAILSLFGKASQRDSLCGSQTCGAGKQVLGITHEGNILPCGRFQWDDPTYYKGSLNQVDQDFQSSQYKENYKEALEKADIIAFLVAHDEFKGKVGLENQTILDFCGVTKQPITI